MSDIIKSIFSNVCEYVPNFSIIQDVKASELLVTYTCNIYDLIDKDLDFNEEHYEHILIDLHRIVVEECKSLVKNNVFKKIYITSAKKIMDSEVRLDTRVTIDCYCVSSVVNI